jgi:DNA repair protein RecO (recombination protein O)
LVEVEWHDEGLLLGVRRHGETSALVDVLTREHGRHPGLVRAGRSRRMRPVLQAGNQVAVTWRARLEDHLGTYTVEPVAMRAAAVIDDPAKLAAVGSLTALCRLLPEREPHARLLEAAGIVLAAIEEGAHWPALMVRWELGLLEELGFGLDLTRCAVTGTGDDLAYVSPRSARAVSAGAGEAWRERLLRLPSFLLGRQAGAAADSDIADGFALTGHFLLRHILEPRGLAEPEPRKWMVAAAISPAAGRLS